MAQLPDDRVVQELERMYKYAVVKILLNNRGNNGWTDFVVDNYPQLIIMTVAHATIGFDDSKIYSANTFGVVFHKNTTIYKAKAVKHNFQSAV
jgi:hypothetical protein